MFHEDVEVLKGSLKLSADEMLVFFDPETKKAQSLVASRNVTVRDGETCAKGTKLTWHAATQIATLYGDPKVSIAANKITISAETAVFYQRENQVETRGGGYLLGPPSTSRPAGKSPASPTPPPAAEAKPVEVAWKGTLLYKVNSRTAHFYEDVRVVRGDVKLRCDQLEVVLDEQASQVQSLHAKQNVRIQQGPATGTGDEFTYQADRAEAELIGEPQAEVHHQDAVVRARVLRFLQNPNKTLAKGPGSLVRVDRNLDGANTATTTTVHWQEGMELLPDQGRAVFTKDAVVTRGDSRLAGDTLTAMFNANRELQCLVGQGHVRLAAAGRTGVGDALDWRLKDGLTTLAGQPKALLVQQGYRITCERFYIRENDNLLEGLGAGTLTSAPARQPAEQAEQAEEVTNVAWAERMVFDGQKHFATFAGGVRVLRGAARLNAQRLRLLLDDQNRIQKLRADEEVTLGDGAREARGDALDWDVATDIADLTAKDRVRINEEGFRGAGRSARYHGKEGRLEVLGPQEPAQAPAKTPPDGKPRPRTTIKLYIDKAKAK